MCVSPFFSLKNSIAAVTKFQVKHQSLNRVSQEIDRKDIGLLSYTRSLCYLTVITCSLLFDSVSGHKHRERSSMNEQISTAER